MHRLTKLIKEDMIPALGVTEPGAIAFATAKARSYTRGNVKSVQVRMNSGMYKNAFTCGIPNSNNVGNVFAAALGVVAGNCEKGLEVLADVTEEDNGNAEKLVRAGLVEAILSDISSKIFIEATVETDNDICTVTIKDKHTNIVKIVVNGKTILKENEDNEKSENSKEEIHQIHEYTLKQLYEYIISVEEKELKFLWNAYEMNLELFQAGLNSSRTTFIKSLYHMNKDRIISEDEVATAQLLCNGAIEARVMGLDKPAMSITGSGAHGIICTMPLYAVFKVNNLTKEQLLRATALSYLVTMYIKEYSGRLSAFCGCAIAAGTGMASALVYLKNGNLDNIHGTINNMASSITGMICDGGNEGCTMKGIVAVDAAFRSVRLAMEGAYILDIHGINAKTPEGTFKNMGQIASPGMIGTEKTILEIFQRK